MSTVSCEPGWYRPVFEKAMRKNVKSTFQGHGSSDVPARFKDNAPGGANFEAWASMPKITYSSDPDTLYDLEKLRTLLESNDCYVQHVVDTQTQAGVVYPKSFYIGLLMGGTAILYTLFKGKK